MHPLDFNDFFANIVSVKPLEDNLTSRNINDIKEHHGIARKKPKTDFNYHNIKTIYLDEIYSDKHYLLGKTDIFYFLAIQRARDIFPCVDIYTNHTIFDLLYKVEDFFKMYPGVAYKSFYRSLLLKHSLEENLEQFDDEPIKVRKI